MGSRLAWGSRPAPSLRLQYGEAYCSFPPATRPVFPEQRPLYLWVFYISTHGYRVQHATAERPRDARAVARQKSIPFRKNVSNDSEITAAHIRLRWAAHQTPRFDMVLHSRFVSPPLPCSLINMTILPDAADGRTKINNMHRLKGLVARWLSNL